LGFIGGEGGEFFLPVGFGLLGAAEEEVLDEEGGVEVVGGSGVELDGDADDLALAEDFEVDGLAGLALFDDVDEDGWFGGPGEGAFFEIEDGVAVLEGAKGAETGHAAFDDDLEVVVAVGALGHGDAEEAFFAGGVGVAGEEDMGDDVLEGGGLAGFEPALLADGGLEEWEVWSGEAQEGFAGFSADGGVGVGEAAQGGGDVAGEIGLGVGLGEGGGGEGEEQSTKSEARNPKQIQSTKYKTDAGTLCGLVLCALYFEFVCDLMLVIWDFNRLLQISDFCLPHG
jgi:hypothetical protein